MATIEQHSDDPAGYVWLGRAVGATGKSRAWIAARVTVYSIGRRDYVKLEALNAEIAKDATPQVKPRAE